MTNDVRIYSGGDVRQSSVDMAINSIEGLFNQMGRSDWDVIDNGSLSLSVNYTYDQYRQEFKEKRPHTFTGDVYGLIYNRALIDGWTFSDECVCGYSWNLVDSDNVNGTPVFIINANIRDVDTTMYKNFAKHELLHNFLRNDIAFDPGNDHSWGTQYHTARWDLSGTESSPMLTGYTESVRRGNQKPDSCCNKDKVRGADYHSGSVSDCAIGEANIVLDNVY
jgi:hypothetical protein